MTTKLHLLGAICLVTTGLWGESNSEAATYPPPSVTQGVLLYSPMDNAAVGAGNGTDSTVNGPFVVQDLDGTPQNGTAQNYLTGAGTVTAHVTAGATGQAGQALTFDLNSTNDNRAVTYGNVHNIGTGDYSVAFWFNPAATNDTLFLASKGNQGSGDLGWSIFMQNGTLYVRVGGGGTANRASQRILPIPTNTWIHVVLVVDNTAGTVTGYRDGSNTGWINGGGGPSGNTFIAGTDITNAYSLALGIRRDGNFEFRGMIDDFALWNRALTPDEVSGICAAGLEGNGLNTALDADGDGLPNSWENGYGLNPNDPTDAANDMDGDGLTNLQEFQRGTNPQEPDSDSDGLADGGEVNTHHTNPLLADTDGDGLNDGAEVNTHATEPLAKDTDGDGLNDGDEVNVRLTLPKNADSDADSYGDGLEVLAGTNPNDPDDIPTFNVAEGLMLYYPFDNADIQGTTVLDRAGAPAGPLNGLSQNDGPTTGLPGFIGEAVEFAGGTNNGNFPCIDLTPHAGTMAGLTDGTIAAWVKVPNEGLTTDVLTIFAVSDKDDASSEVRFWISNGGGTGYGALVYGVRNDGATQGTGAASGSVNPLLDGQWHQVAVTLNSGAVNLFIDGVSVASGASTFFAGVTDVDTAGVGRNLDNTVGGGQWFFDGFMDELALWSRPLSAAEVRFIYDEARKGNALLPPAADSDGDGMPDSYEEANGLDQNTNDAEGDLDGDGARNLDEYQAGTGPNDPASALRVTRLLGNPLEFTIVWSSVPGKVYAVEASADLSPGSWQVLTGAENIPASAGATTNFEDTSSEGLTQRFFRVRLVR